jgi:hypothetical protein
LRDHGRASEESVLGHPPSSGLFASSQAPTRPSLFMTGPQLINNSDTKRKPTLSQTAHFRKNLQRGRWRPSSAKVRVGYSPNRRSVVRHAKRRRAAVHTHANRTRGYARSLAAWRRANTRHGDPIDKYQDEWTLVSHGFTLTQDGVGLISLVFERPSVVEEEIIPRRHTGDR